MHAQNHFLTLVTFLPLLGVLAMLLLKSDDHVSIRRIALVTSLIEFVFSLGLLRYFSSADPNFQLQEIHDWIGRGIQYHLGIDGISLFLVLLTTFLTPLAILCSWRSIQKNVKGFFISLLVIETAMIGVFVSLDLFLFFVFWELTLIPMYFIVGIWGHERRVYAAIKFILYTMFGSILMLVAILWLYNLSPGTRGLPATFDFPEILYRMSHGQIPLGGTTEMLLFLAFLLAFAIKVPLFPLHTWLPDAHTEAPTAGSVILAGVMLKLGTYGILRFCLPLFPHAVMRAAPYVATLAIIGIVYGALVATVQRDLKRLVAYTSVSHLGFVVLGIFALNTIAVQGAVYQMLNHGVSTGALFLAVGMLYDRRHTHDIKQFGGLTTPMPVLMAFFCFIALSSLALPPLNGFIGEFLILIGTFAGHRAWAVWATSGAVLSAIYLLWAYQRVAFGKVTVDKNQKLPDASLREKLILVTLAAAIIFMGVASPLFTHRMAASADNVLRPFNQMQEAMRAKEHARAKLAISAPHPAQLSRFVGALPRPEPRRLVAPTSAAVLCSAGGSPAVLRPQAALECGSLFTLNESEGLPLCCNEAFVAPGTSGHRNHAPTPAALTAATTAASLIPLALRHEGNPVPPQFAGMGVRAFRVPDGVPGRDLLFPHPPLAVSATRVRHPERSRLAARDRAAEGSLFGFVLADSPARPAPASPRLLGGRSFSSDIRRPVYRSGALAPDLLLPSHPLTPGASPKSIAASPRVAP